MKAIRLSSLACALMRSVLRVDGKVWLTMFVTGIC
jgi:hypothetical protein